MTGGISKGVRLGLAAFAGATYAAVLPPSALGWVAWCVLVPVAWLIRGTSRAGDALAWGAVFGIASVVVPLGWVGGALVATNGVSLAFAVAATLAAYALGALNFAAFGVLAVALRQRRLPLLLAMPVAWVAVEFARAELVLGVPWLLLGHSQSEVAATRPFAAFLGVPGLSFAIVLVNAAIAEALARREVRARLAHAAFAAAVLLAVCLTAQLRSQQHLARQGVTPLLKVGLVQAAIPQSDRWVPALANRNLQQQLRLSRRAVTSGAELIVWSETALDFLPDRAPTLGSLLSNALLGRSEARLLLGAPRRRAEEGALYNGAVLFDGAGHELAAYHKVRLLPLHEYTPAWVDLVPGARWALGPILNPHPYAGGSDSTLLPTPAGPAGALICYEGMYAQLAEQLRVRGARYLVNLSNDAVFASARASAQMFAATRFVAIETGLPMIRVSNRGVTGVVDPLGRLSGAEPPDQPSVSIVDLPASLSAPVASASGRLSGAGVLLVALAAFALARARRSKEGR